MKDNNWILRLLQNNICVVTFDKVDGTSRTMKCTLNDLHLPEQYKNKGSLLTETDKNTLSVWDLESNGWRSFRFDNVRSITVENNQHSSSELLLG